MAVSSNSIGNQVLDALGITLQGVTGLKLEMRADQAVSITVSYFPEREQVEDCIELIKRYALVEREKTAQQRYMPSRGCSLRFPDDPQLPGWRESVDTNVAAAKARIHDMAERAHLSLRPEGFIVSALRGMRLQ